MTATVEAEATEVTETDSVDENKAPGKRGRKAEPRDFSVWREDHESFANYINELYPDVAITPAQVKASFLLRGDWANTPERLAEREASKARTAEEAEARAQRKAEKEAEKALEESLSPEEKEKRKERTKAVKAAERAAKRAEELRKKAEELANEAFSEETPETPAEIVEQEAVDEVAGATEAPSEDAKPRRPRKRPSA